MSAPESEPGREEFEETRELVKSAFLLARSLGIATLLVQADEIADVRLIEGLRETERVIWIVRDRADVPISDPARDIVLVVPDAALNRLAQLNLALFLAALNQLVRPDERVLGLSGVTGSLRLDTLVISRPAHDYPWLQRNEDAAQISGHVAKLLEIALLLARQGREGSPIGTIWVLGEPGALAPYLRQLILNPLQGHPAEARSIYNPGLLETLRELAAMDGAFIVNRSGVVESAATYLDAPIGKGRMSPGLGARHAAARAITGVTKATAVVVSASSGNVSLYDQGETVLQLESAHPRWS